MKNNPSVALVHDWLVGYAGGEQVLMAFHKLFPDAPIYTSLWNPEKTHEFSDATIIPSYLQKIPFLKNHHQVAIPLMPMAFESFDLKGFDIVISIGTGMAKGVITHPEQHHIYYCNTPPRYLWRLGGDSRNENRSDSWLRTWASHNLRLWDIVSAERVDTFIGNSQNVVDRIKKIYRRDAVVIYPPVNTDNYRIFENVDDYFLTVGRLVEYKRVDLIIQACKQLNLPLKIVGEGPEEPRLRQLVGESTSIEFLGRVSDAELPELYGRAKAFIFPAEEDFGIVPVEAMSAGRPVIALGRGGARETVADGKSGLFFEEQTVQSLLSTLEKFKIEDFDPHVIKEHAEQFSLQNFSENIYKLVEKVA